jgi:hypothetical protein
LEAEDLRQGKARCFKTLKQDKALESCKINGLLFLNLDANEHFASRSRCCPACGQRNIETLGPDGQKERVAKYHRYVFAQINGPKINGHWIWNPLVRAKTNARWRCGCWAVCGGGGGPRFFDAITAGAWCAKGPFLRAVAKLGWAWIVVFKRETWKSVKKPGN